MLNISKVLILSRTLPLLTENKRTIAEIDIMPNPPICINVIRTILPKRVSSFEISITVSPVTQTALVAVNKASIKCIFPLTVLKGKYKSKLPKVITNTKEAIINWYRVNFEYESLNQFITIIKKNKIEPAIVHAIL